MSTRQRFKANTPCVAIFLEVRLILRNSLFISLLTGVVFYGLISCTPSIYQSPKVLKPGEKVLGIGFSFQRIKEEDGEEAAIIPTDLSLYTRFGVFNRMDIGFKIFGFPNLNYSDLESPTWEDALLGYSLFFDAKYNLVQQPLLISVDVGFLRASSYPFEDRLDTRGIHPMLLFGSEHSYGGIGWNYLIFHEDNGQIRRSSKEPSVRALIGTSLSRGRFQFNPELSFCFRLPKHKSKTLFYSYPFFAVGFGIQYTFSK